MWDYKRKYSIERAMQVIITLIFNAFLVMKAIGSDVNINVEDGFNLEGLQCPKTVTVLCTGLEVVSLRWRYNGEMNIISYFSDGTQSTPEAPFFTVRLLSVTQNPINRNLANFSSSLTVNYLQLESNNVTDISCGTPGTSCALPVNVSIIQPGPPSSPVIAMVTAAYQSGELNSIEIKWNIPDNTCPTATYGLSLDYEVNITKNISNRLNQSSCSDTLCVTSFENFVRNSSQRQYEISVQAENELGSSDVVVYPITLAHQIQQYFQFKVFERNNQIIGQCTATAELIGATKCRIHYTIMSVTRNISDQVTVVPNKEFPIDDAPPSGATYNFQFSVLVSSTLLITGDEDFESSAPERTDSGVPAWGVIIIVLILLGVLLTPILIFIALFLYKRNGGQKGPTEEYVQELETKAESQYEIHVQSVCTQKEGKETYPTYVIEIQFQDEKAIVGKSYTDFKRLQKQLQDRQNSGGEKLELPSQDLPLNSKGKREGIKTQQAGLYKFVLNVLTEFPKNSAVVDFFEECYPLYFKAVEQNATLKETTVT